MVSQLLRLWIATMGLYVAGGGLFPLFSLYMSWRGLSEVEIGFVVSIAALASLVPTVLLGLYSDVVPNRELLQASICAAQAVIALAYRAVTTLTGFLLLHPLFMAVSYSAMTLSGAVAMEYIPKRRGRGFGRLRTAGAVGWIGGTLIGGFIADRIGFEAVFVAAAAAYAATSFLYWLGARRKGTSRLRTRSSPPSFKTVIETGEVRALLVAVFIASLSNPAYYTFLPLFIAEELKGSPLLSSLAFTVTPLAEVPAMLTLGALSDIVGRLKVIAACLAAYPVRYALTAVSTSPLQAILTQLLHGLTFGGLYVVSTAYLSEKAGKATGLALSLYTVAMNTGNLVGSYLLAQVVSVYGFRVMFLTASALSSLSLIPLAVLRIARR